MRVHELAWSTDEVRCAYDSDLLLSIEPVIVALLIRERNAWNSTWVRHYLNGAAMYGDVASAKAGAERQRERGNVFSIRELPAIVLRGDVSTVVLADAHPDNPFSDYLGIPAPRRETQLGTCIRGIYPGVSVRDAVLTFQHDSGLWAGSQPSEHSLRSGRVGETFRSDWAPRALYAATSYAQGTNYPLGWAERPSRHLTSGTQAIADRWTAMLADAELSTTPTSEDLARHRSGVLGVLPYSLWEEAKQAAVNESQAQVAAADTEWEELSDLVARIEDEVYDAEDEIEAAREAQLRPAETSRGVPEQRERVERALERLEYLRRSVAQAEAAANAAWDRRYALRRHVESMRLGESSAT